MEKAFRADLIGMIADRNFGLFEVRRLDAPGRQYRFTASIEGPQSSGIRTDFTLNLDANTVVPIPTSPG